MGIPLSDDLFDCRYKPDIWRFCQEVINTLNAYRIKSDAEFDNLDNRVTALEEDSPVTSDAINGVNMNGVDMPIQNNKAVLGTVITDVSNKQDILVSGTNIKTVNGNSLLGSGNITISGGSSGIEGVNMNGADVPIQNNKAILGTVITDISSKQDVIDASNKLAAAYISGLATVATSGSYNDLTDKIGNASTSAYGITKLSSSTNSTSTTLAATPSAVRSAYQLASTANSNANSAMTVINDMQAYPVGFGVSQDWNYIRFSNNYIHAWRTYNADMSASGTQAATINLPFEMADTNYVVTVDEGSYRLSKAWNITFDRTTTTTHIAWTVTSAESGASDLISLILDGYAVQVI